MSTDFRTLYLNDAIKDRLNDIYDLLRHEKSITEQTFDLLYQSLFDYYQFEYEPKIDKYTAQDRAKKILSDYQQHLIYYAYHNIKNAQYNKELTSTLIRLSSFYYQSIPDQSAGRFVLWTDPKEDYTALNTLARSGDNDNLQSLLIKTSTLLETTSSCIEEGEVVDAEEGEITNNLSTLLFNRDKCGFSPFHTACNEGHIDVVQTLLAIAKKTFAKDPSGLIKFISQENELGFSPLNSACKGGHLEIVRVLLETAENVFGNNRKGFVDFINHRDNIIGNTPLHNVSFNSFKELKQESEEKYWLRVERHRNIAQLLLNYGACILKNNRNQQAIQCAPYEWRFNQIQKSSSKKRDKRKKEHKEHKEHKGKSSSRKRNRDETEYGAKEDIRPCKKPHIDAHNNQERGFNGLMFSRDGDTNREPEQTRYAEQTSQPITTEESAFPQEQKIASLKEKAMQSLFRNANNSSSISSQQNYSSKGNSPNKSNT